MPCSQNTKLNSPGVMRLNLAEGARQVLVVGLGRSCRLGVPLRDVVVPRPLEAARVAGQVPRHQPVPYYGGAAGLRRVAG